MNDEKFFNDLSPAELERLAIVSEECAEVIQIIQKIIRHGYDSRHPNGGPTNRGLLEIELGHVSNGCAMMHEAGDISRKNISDSINGKIKSIKKYLHHQGGDS